MKGDLFLLYNLERGGWYGRKGEIVHDVQEAMLYKYAAACELVELANSECDAASPPVALMAKA